MDIAILGRPGRLKARNSTQRSIIDFLIRTLTPRHPSLSFFVVASCHRRDRASGDPAHFHSGHRFVISTFPNENTALIAKNAKGLVRSRARTESFPSLAVGIFSTPRPRIGFSVGLTLWEYSWTFPAETARVYAALPAAMIDPARLRQQTGRRLHLAFVGSERLRSISAASTMKPLQKKGTCDRTACPLTLYIMT